MRLSSEHLTLTPSLSLSLSLSVSLCVSLCSFSPFSFLRPLTQESLSSPKPKHSHLKVYIFSQQSPSVALLKTSFSPSPSKNCPSIPAQSVTAACWAGQGRVGRGWAGPGWAELGRHGVRILCLVSLSLSRIGFRKLLSKQKLMFRYRELDLFHLICFDSSIHFVMVQHQLQGFNLLEVLSQGKIWGNVGD